LAEVITLHNSTHPKVAVQWLKQAKYLYQSFCLVDSEVIADFEILNSRQRICLPESTLEIQ
jgi:hypothetical protein